MTLVIAHYHNVEDFRAVAEPYLSRHEVKNNLLLSLIRYMAGTHHEAGPAHCWTVLDGDLIVGVALRTGDGRALVFSEMPLSCVALLAADVKKHIPALSEINGPVEVVEAFAAAFGRKTSLIMHLGAYSCASAVIPKVTTGGFRKATFDDLELLIGWNEAFSLEAMGTSGGDPRALLKTKIDHGALFLWEDDAKRPACQTYSAAPTANGIRITGVYTPKDLRGRGYASSLVAHVTKSLLDSGYKFVFLFTDMANPTSNSIYQRIGYQQFGEMKHLRLVAAD
ncbi:MAG: GNAT family N-acetyltransferase [Pseudomonadota bacterium]